MFYTLYCIFLLTKNKSMNNIKATTTLTVWGVHFKSSLVFVLSILYRHVVIIHVKLTQNKGNTNYYLLQDNNWITSYILYYYCGSVAERSKVSNSGPMVVSSNPALGHQCWGDLSNFHRLSRSRCYFVELRCRWFRTKAASACPLLETIDRVYPWRFTG